MEQGVVTPPNGTAIQTPLSGEPRRLLAMSAFAVVASVVVLLAYVTYALDLLRYPWDWLPDEGLSLDLAARLLRSPTTLYPSDTVVPFPAAYGPVLPVVLAPVVAFFGKPLMGARAVAMAWVLLSALLVHLLVRRNASAATALAATALSVAPFSMTFWNLLVRPDGLMLSLWLLAAVAVLPHRLQRGADVLGTGRLVAGVTSTLLAVLTKPTAVILCVPLVLGWIFVDRRSFIRLTMGLGATGLATLGLLQLATGGGFLMALRIWLVHPIQPGAWLKHSREFVDGGGGLILLLWGVLMAVAARHGREPLRDSSILLVAGGLLTAPAMAKHGALWSYLLPALAGLAVMIGRLAGGEGEAGDDRPTWWSRISTAAVAGVALALSVTRPFPLPTPLDDRTSAAFFAFIETATRQGATPILASKPEYAYWVARQPSDIESISFFWLARAGAPGTERVFDGLRTGHYGLVVDQFPVPLPAYNEPLNTRYRLLGGCGLGYYFGPAPTRLWLRADMKIKFEPAPDTRCLAIPTS